MLRILMIICAILGVGAVLKFSSAVGMALVLPVLTGMAVGAAIGFVIWMVIRAFLITDL